jgi:hypothetical protein
LNPACPQPYFRGDYHTPYPSQAAQKRAWRAKKKLALADVKAPITARDYMLWQADCLRVFAASLIQAHSVGLILADLPYGHTAAAWDRPLPLEELWPCYARVLGATGAVILTATFPFALKLVASKPAWFRHQIVWVKSNHTTPQLTGKEPLHAHELILVFAPRQPTFHPQIVTGCDPVSAFYDETKSLGEALTSAGGTSKKLISMHKANPEGTRQPTNVLYCPQQRGGTHDTQKPVALMRWLIAAYSDPGDVVLDNTMGSGTTGVACVETGRRFLGIELQPAYVAAACQRIDAQVKAQETQAAAD